MYMLPGSYFPFPCDSFFSQQHSIFSFNLFIFFSSFAFLLQFCFRIFSDLLSHLLNTEHACSSIWILSNQSSTRRECHRDLGMENIMQFIYALYSRVNIIYNILLEGAVGPVPQDLAKRNKKSVENASSRNTTGPIKTHISNDQSMWRMQHLKAHTHIHDTHMNAQMHTYEHKSHMWY